MDPFNLLKTDHRNVAKLFDQLEAARGNAKLSVFDQIRTELELHTHIEEKIFYPALEKPEETHDLTLEAYEEHAVVKTLLRELSRAKTADDEWEAQAKVLRENVEHHVEEEENELFEKADAALSAEELTELGERMQEEKSRKQRSAASKSSSSKSAGSKKSAGKSKAGSKAAKKTGGSKKATSASKKTSRSSAAKTKKRSRSSKKSAAKKR